MPTKTLEIDFGIIMSGPDADGCVAQLVQIPPGSILFPQRVGLTIGQASVPVCRQVCATWRSGLPRGDKQRPNRRLAALFQVVVQVA